MSSERMNSFLSSQEKKRNKKLTFLGSSSHENPPFVLLYACPRKGVPKVDFNCPDMPVLSVSKVDLFDSETLCFLHVLGIKEIFRHTLAESATFPPCSEMGMWYFRPGYGEK